MLYKLLKIAVRLALGIFCRRIMIRGEPLPGEQGALLVTANHPNSFLDAVIIGSRFRRPVHFLARGDAFRKPWHNTLLRLLQMVPVYRLSEGKENLSLNEEAFRQSKEILAKKGIILIFIEGICLHTHVLQPFKKGAARIALESRDLPGFRVLPLGIAYDSFTRFGKSVHIAMTEPVAAKELLPFADDARNMQFFNMALYAKIGQCIDIPAPQKNTRPGAWLLFVPSAIGLMLHLPLYTLLRNSIRQRTERTVFFDSVLFGALLLVYPAYLLLLGILLFCMKVPILVIAVVLTLHPLTAWCAVRWKRATLPEK